LLPILLAMAGLGAFLVACGDDPTTPDALFDFAEAESVMRSAAALPSLPELATIATPAANAAQRAGLVRAQELWLAGTLSHAPSARSDRQQAVVLAAPFLVDLIPADGWDPLRDRIEHWVRTADAMVHHFAMPAVEVHLEGARRELDRVDAASSAEERAHHLLLAMSELVETTPRLVARRLVEEAAAAVSLAEERAAALSGSSASLRRARRLADWAARGAEEGDHLRAIQRAYYAIQLAEER
jgi:hypothetical protein